MSGTVLHVFDHSFPINDGYAFRSAEIVGFERRNGWRTVHVTSAKQGASALAQETVDGLSFSRTPPPDGWLARQPVFDQWAVVTSLRRRLDDVIAAERPDVLHAHSPALNGLAALAAARRHGLPLVYEVRAFWEDAAVDKGACREGDLRYRVTRAMETWVLRRADRVTCICEGLRGDILARGIAPGRVTVVPNAVDIGHFGFDIARDDALAARFGLPHERTLGFIGSFFAFEGLQVLIDAMPIILRSEPQARLLLVGSGVQDAALREQARRLGLEREVVFAGRVAHADVQRYYGLVDVFVYPRIPMRITELVTPLKPLEAMAQGRLVVASDVGGHREMVEDGRTGLLFRAGDPESLAQACVRMLRERDRWADYRRAARAYVETERDWGVISRRYDAVYRQALEGR
ncbi:MAG: TIGR04063 family PEP-CTERM/XrtA system glycosyltransferase [Gammaproteobacteria bacterium]